MVINKMIYLLENEFDCNPDLDQELELIPQDEPGAQLDQNQFPLVEYDLSNALPLFLHLLLNLCFLIKANFILI